MTSFLQIDKLTKSYGDRLLFGNVTFGVNEGDKIGIIAKNGTGKSTLLRIIAGLESQDSGDITFRKGLRVGYLEQIPTLNPEMNVLEACLEGIHDGTIDEEPAEDRLKRLLFQLGITDTEALVSTLSGGQIKRAAIARTILNSPDLLMLDEPTNHLDIDVIEWLEQYLSRSRVTLLMVTHDRYFLDRVCSKIIEIDRTEIFSYDGNYDYYLRRRKERIEALTGELAKVRNTLRREQEWMSRQPQARAGKAKFRIDSFYNLKEQSKADYSERNVSLDVNSSYIGNKIFEASHISKSWGDKKVLDDFSYTFARYEKVGIIGHNGVGKSTFIKMLLGLVKPDAGKWDIGETVRFGYYSQDGIRFKPGARVIDAVTDIADDIVLDGQRSLSPMQFLNHFLFSPADQLKYVEKLSGGELCRLHLATVLMRSPNFLILDEPTNDLDIVTLGLLEEYLRDYKGCAIIISHDRFFLDSIVDHLFVFQGNGIVKDFPGNYTDYRKWVKEHEKKDAPAKTNEAKVSSKPKVNKQGKMTYKERKEYESLPVEIDKLTAERDSISKIFSSGENIKDIRELSARYEELNLLIDEKEMRWLELSEKA